MWICDHVEINDSGPHDKRMFFLDFIAPLNIPYPAAFKLSERIEDLGIQVKKHS